MDQLQSADEDRKAIELFREKCALVEAYSVIVETEDEEDSTKEVESEKSDGDDYITTLFPHMKYYKSEKYEKPLGSTLQGHYCRTYPNGHRSAVDFFSKKTFSFQDEGESSQCTNMPMLAKSIGDPVDKASMSPAEIVTPISTHMKRFCPKCARLVDIQVIDKYNSCALTTAVICCLVFPFLVIFAWIPLVFADLMTKVIVCDQCGATIGVYEDAQKPEDT